MWLTLAAFAGGMHIISGINDVFGLQSTAALFADLSIITGLWLAFGFLLGVSDRHADLGVSAVRHVAAASRSWVIPETAEQIKNQLDTAGRKVYG